MNLSALDPETYAQFADADLAAEVGECPLCGSIEIETRPHIDAEGVLIEAFCSACGITWDEEQ